MTTKSHATLARLGTDEERKHVYDMLAVAFNVSESDRKRPEVRATLYNAMNESILWGLVPNRDCYMVPYRAKGESGNWENKYSFIISIHGLRQFRARYEQMSGKTFDIQFRTMEPDELSLHLPEDQIPGAVGVEAMWIDFEAAREYKEIGVQYKPRRYYGFWLERSREVDEWVSGKKTGNKAWKADPIQTARTPRDIAERRAERAALLANIPPVPLNDFEESRKSQVFLNQIQEQAHEAVSAPPESASAMLVDSAALVEDETGLMFEPEPVRQQAQPVFDEEDDEEPAENDAEAAYLERVRELDREGKPPSAARYRATVGILEDAMGIDGCHTGVLEWLLGRRPVDKTHPPSHEACDWIVRKVQLEMADSNGEIMENPTFDPALHDLLSSKAQAIAETS
jgi:hypothetical protein